MPIGPRAARILQVQACHQEFLEQLQHTGKANPTAHIFNDRLRLPDRARQRVREACLELGISIRGTQGFHKHFANQEYTRHIEVGASDREALLATSHQLGHNRIHVTIQSYIPIQNRGRVGKCKTGRRPADPQRTRLGLRDRLCPRRCQQPDLSGHGQAQNAAGVDPSYGPG